jgi:glutathione S-transferase
MKVIWLLEELGLPYERVDAGGAFGGTNTPEFQRLNPLPIVPALQDDDFGLFESNAILRYICMAHAPSSPFYPSQPRGRAEVEAWMDFQQTALGPPMATAFLGLIRTPPERRDNVAISAAIKQAGELWALLNKRLSRHDFIVGDTMTLADIAHGALAHRWIALDIPHRTDAPHFAAWYRRLLERPAYQKYLAVELV